MPHSVDGYIDCRGLHAPLPVIEIAKALERLPYGATLCVDADDKSFRRDLEGWLAVHQEKLVAFYENLKSQTALIEKATPFAAAR